MRPRKRAEGEDQGLATEDLAVLGYFAELGIKILEDQLVLCLEHHLGDYTFEEIEEIRFEIQRAQAIVDKIRKAKP